MSAEALEPRRLFAAAYPSNLEQYAVELINRGRANPSAEASRYGIALNEGLAAGTISTAAKQPLAINPYLTGGARGHSQWMIDTDVFSHTGAGGSDPGDRMTSAGYDFVAPWTWGENIAWKSAGGSAATATVVGDLHKNLFVDAGIAGRGHRTNLMSNAFREIGAGFVAGNMKGYAAGMLTTDFAGTAGSAFLTGVAFNDNLISKDNFYTPGEGLGGVTVTATRLTDGAIFSTGTWSSGGYSLQLPAGTYQVTGSGAGLGAPVTFGSVAIGSTNVKKDFLAGVTSPTPTPTDTTAPTATLTKAKRRGAAGRYHPLIVQYADDRGLNVSTFDNFDVVVTGPNGFSRGAIFTGVALSAGDAPKAVGYKIKGPGAGWDTADNGVYTIKLVGSQVRDASGNAAAAKTLGTFTVAIPATVSPALMTRPFSVFPVAADDRDFDPVLA
jgi:uncharacterized protein YkwD